LDNPKIFAEFLQIMVKDSWKIILTTMNNSFSDLLNLINKFKIDELMIQNLSLEKLNELSTTYKFKIPDDKKLKKFLTKLFYLNEYLQILAGENTEINDIEIFKDKIWITRVLGLENSVQDKRKRESCFLRFIKKKSDGNLFLINLNEKYHDILASFENDEIITYDNDQDAFFITHDMYEELALERIIQREFKRSKSSYEFFKNIGNSLSMKKAFKEWLINQLNENSNVITSFLDDVILNENIEEFWKNETTIPILLSDYSETFLKKYENEILKNDKKFLKKIISLLIMACKEINEDEFFKSVLTKIGSISDYFYTKPKGVGWKHTISFIHDNLDKFEISDMDLTIPILKEWNENNNNGTTTKKSSLIALHFYREIQAERKFNNRSEESLIKVIFSGALEIKNELEEIFKDILKNKWKNSKDPHYTLCKNLLKDYTTPSDVLKILPSYVLKIADLYWYKNTTNLNLMYDKNKNPIFL
jgi:hypothetical protein